MRSTRSRVLAPAALGSVRLRAAAVLVAAGVAATVLYRFDPAGGAWFFPPCPFLALTGLECPGCGSTRAVHRLLHGELGRALALNPLLVVYLPALGFFLLDQLHRLGSGHGLPAPRPAPIWIWALLALILGFGVMRNVSAI